MRWRRSSRPLPAWHDQPPERSTHHLVAVDLRLWLLRLRRSREIVGPSDAGQCAENYLRLRVGAGQLDRVCHDVFERVDGRHSGQPGQQVDHDEGGGGVERGHGIGRDRCDRGRAVRDELLALIATRGGEWAVGDEYPES
jgi:hypothetical protein